MKNLNEKINRKERKEVYKFIQFIEEIIHRYSLSNPIIKERIERMDKSVGAPAFKRNFSNIRKDLISNLAILKVCVSNKEKITIQDAIRNLLESYTTMIKYITEYYIDFKDIEEGIHYTKDENIINLMPPVNPYRDGIKFLRFDKAMSIMRRLSYHNPQIKREFEVSFYTYYKKERYYRDYYHNTLKLIDLLDVNNTRLINHRMEKLNRKSIY